MTGLNERESELQNTRQNLNEQQFDSFEFKMAQKRVSDLEAHLDKLLESTADQRKKIEDYEEQIESMTKKFERLQMTSDRKSERIAELEINKTKLERDLTYMTDKKKQFEAEAGELADTLVKRNAKISDLET